MKSHNICHGDVFTIPLLVHFFNQISWKDLEVLVKIFLVEERRLCENNRIHSIPPGVLPSHVTIIASEWIECVHSRRESNESSEKSDEVNGTEGNRRTMKLTVDLITTHDEHLQDQNMKLTNRHQWKEFHQLVEV